MRLEQRIQRIVDDIAVIRDEDDPLVELNSPMDYALGAAAAIVRYAATVSAENEAGRCDEVSEAFYLLSGNASDADCPRALVGLGKFATIAARRAVAS